MMMMMMLLMMMTMMMMLMMMMMMMMMRVMMMMMMMRVMMMMMMMMHLIFDAYTPSLSHYGSALQLVDFQGRGILQLSRLVTSLLSAEFHRVVLTSAALSIIFAHGCYADNARPNNGVRTVDIPLLLPVFIDTFSSTPPPSHRDISHSATIVSSISARDWISKADFLDFCIAAVEVKKYTLTM